MMAKIQAKLSLTSGRLSMQLSSMKTLMRRAARINLNTLKSIRSFRICSKLRLRVSSTIQIPLEIIAKSGTTVEQFFVALKEESEKDKEGEASFAIQVILSVTEYSNFVDMIKHYKREAKDK